VHADPAGLLQLDEGSAEIGALAAGAAAVGEQDDPTLALGVDEGGGEAEGGGVIAGEIVLRIARDQGGRRPRGRRDQGAGGARARAP
jgi:hypothetical protein